MLTPAVAGAGHLHPALARTPVPAVDLIDRVDPQVVTDLIAAIQVDRLPRDRRAQLITDRGGYRRNPRARRALFYLMWFTHRPDAPRAQFISEVNPPLPSRDSPAVNALIRMGVSAVPTVVDEAVRVAAADGAAGQEFGYCAVIVLRASKAVARAVDRLLERRDRAAAEPAVRTACEGLIGRILESFPWGDRKDIFPPAALAVIK